MASFMAPITRLFFCFIEPALVSYGGIVYLISPGQYSAALVGGAVASPDKLPPSSFLAAEQLSSINLGTMTLLVAALMAIVMWICENPRTVRLVILALGLADIPHWGAAAHVLWSGSGSGSGSGTTFANPNTWSTELTQNMLGPVFTCSFKIAYLIGWLGRDRTRDAGMVLKDVKRF